MLEVARKAKKEEKPQENKPLLLLNKYFNVVLVIIVVAIFIAGYFIFINKEFLQVKEKTNQEREKEDQIVKNNDLTYNLAKVNQSYKSIEQEKKDQVDRALPPYSNIEELYAQMEYLLSKQGMLLDSVGVQDSKREKVAVPVHDAKKDAIVGAPEGVETIGIKLGISGVDYKGLKRLLGAYESNLQLIDLEKISFSPNGNAVNLIGRTYFVK